jgi:uncharacterized membrane protein
VKKILPVTNAVIAVLAGVFVLLGYFFPQFFGGIQSTLIGWAIILAAFGLLLGIFNLALVHWKKITSKDPGRLYSLVLLISLILTFVLAGISGPTGTLSLWIFNTFQVPVEISLLAILAIILVYSAARMIVRRPRWNTVLFLSVVLLVLLGSVPLLFIGEIAPLSALQSWISQVPGIAGARGLLLGVALGTVATGLRILMGMDRPYGG